MNNRLPLHILSAATVLLFAATACTQDDLGGGTLPEGEYPLVIRATGLQAVATPASTRATVDGDWDGVTSVTLCLGDETKEYNVTTTDAEKKTATLSNNLDPFWWTSRKDITVSAWWPYTDGQTSMPAVTVQADQRSDGYAQSDHIGVTEELHYDGGTPTLAFTHRTARIIVTVSGSTSAVSSVHLTNLSTADGNPGEIIAHHAGSGIIYEALTAPQTVKANTPFIQVDLGGGTYYFRPQSAVVLEAGSRYTYTVNVNATGLTLEGCTIGGWTDGGGESGTAEDLGYTYNADTRTYRVYNEDGLLAWAEVAQSDLSINCTLTADINMKDKTWTPVGNSDQTYNGTFDGQGHRITGLTITTNSTGGQNATLFDYIGSDGTVKNLQVEVNYNVRQNGAAGGIANANYGTITVCSVNGDITASNGAAGGIASFNNGSIIGCWYNGQLKGNNGSGGTPMGGIAYINYGAVAACYWGGNAGQGVYNNQEGTVDATKVNDGESWQTAVDGMNKALTDNDYKWELSADDLPVLQKNQ